MNIFCEHFPKSGNGTRWWEINLDCRRYCFEAAFIGVSALGTACNDSESQIWPPRCGFDTCDCWHEARWRRDVKDCPRQSDRMMTVKEWGKIGKMSQKGLEIQGGIILTEWECEKQKRRGELAQIHCRGAGKEQIIFTEFNLVSIKQPKKSRICLTRFSDAAIDFKNSMEDKVKHAEVSFTVQK